MRLQGLLVAGVRVAVEVPEGAPWATGNHTPEPDAGVCSPYEPDVYVGVRIGEPRFPHCETGEFARFAGAAGRVESVESVESVVYSSRGRTFEVARAQSEWWIATHSREGYDRVVRFDDRFAEGEVVIHPRAAARLTHPLEHPLDELLAVHRTARAGGLVMRGTAVPRDGRALVFAGPSQPHGSGDDGPLGSPPNTGRWTSVVPSDVRGGLALLPDGDGARVHRMPRVGRGDAASALDARLDAIHLIERSVAVFSHRLDADEAAEELLLHVFAPVHDPESAERMATSALRLTQRVPVLRLGLPGEDRVVPFTWGHRRAALAFAPPYAG